MFSNSKIKLMQFRDLILGEVFDLPRSYANLDYYEYLKMSLSELNTSVQSLEDFTNKVPQLHADLGYVKTNYKKLVDGLIKCVEYYYEGFPEKAFSTLEETLTSNKIYENILRNRIIDSGSNFYRIRFSNSIKLFKRKEMFHIPFDLRSLVGTQRFSIPGFPSLYLGNNVYVCWEELGRPKINEFQAIKYTLNDSIRILDLTSFSKVALKEMVNKDENQIPKELYDYFMTFPLILACSIKVANRNHAFKPEYIIPQLILQRIRKDSFIDGIKYTTTHINQNNTNTIGQFNNFVLPVKNNNTSGHCTYLLDKFSSTEVVSWQMLQYLYPNGKNTGYTLVEHFDKEIELVKGDKSAYHNTSFGLIENYLSSLSIESMYPAD